MASTLAVCQCVPVYVLLFCVCPSFRLIDEIQDSLQTTLLSTSPLCSRRVPPGPWCDSGFTRPSPSWTCLASRTSGSSLSVSTSTSTTFTRTRSTAEASAVRLSVRCPEVLINLLPSMQSQGAKGKGAKPPTAKVGAPPTKGNPKASRVTVPECTNQLPARSIAGALGGKGGTVPGGTNQPSAQFPALPTNPKRHHASRY